MITQKKWTENLILDLVKNKVPESLTMEYKRIDALRNNNKNKNEISKDVSAFANSAGGTLIYGVVEDGHHPTEIDEGVSPDDISKEWLEQVINSRISRKIPDLLIHQIEISKPKGNVIYVIEIPQSHLAPHMASDYRYYKRYNFQSVPMEEYEVRDVGNRNVVPDLSINPVFEKNELTYNTIDYSDQFNLNLIMSNESLTPAEYHISKLYLDDRLNVSPHDEVKKLSEKVLYFKNNKVNVTELAIVKNAPASYPILHGVNFTLLNRPLRVSFSQNDEVFYIYATVHTAGTEPKEFLFTIERNSEEIKLNTQNLNDFIE